MIMAALSPYLGGAQAPLLEPATFITSTTGVIPDRTAFPSIDPKPSREQPLYTDIEISRDESAWRTPQDADSAGQTHDGHVEASHGSQYGQHNGDRPRSFSDLLGSVDTGRRATIAKVSRLWSFLTQSRLCQSLLPNGQHISAQQLQEASWLASSSAFLDRKSCTWRGVCRAIPARDHSSQEAEQMRKEQERVNEEESILNAPWAESKTRPEDWSDDERIVRDIPQYVLDHTPLVHLFSDEQFWPCDIENHLLHTTPHLNYTPLQGRAEHPNLTNLDQLNRWNRGRFVYLQSDDDPEERPEWLIGQENIPSFPDEGNALDEGHEEVGGELPRDRTQSDLRTKAKNGGRSDAPAVLIVVDKGDGIVDAFWFYFYSFNLGNVVFNVRFGNHVGDWEHSMVRFQHGVPKAVYLSEHNFGDAYSYEAIEKIGKRPVIYSATGTHAMYATPGIHQYVLPWGLLRDVTDRGPLWDPLLNSHMYTYDHSADNIRSSNVTPHAPTEWFYFAGHWGDKFYSLDDSRQYQFAGQYHYVNGPIGPRFKNLGRKNVCQGRGRCHIRNWIMEDQRTRRWKGVGEGEELSEEDILRIPQSDDE